MTRIVAAVCMAAISMGAASAHGATAGPRCGSGDLAGALIDVQGAAGSSFGRVILTNTSTRTCHLKGFASGRFIARDGHTIPTDVTRDHSTPVRRVVVKPGAAAAFQLRWSNVPTGGQQCTIARWLRVTPPHATGSVRVYFGAAPCRGELEVRAITDPRGV
jgi:hypothetical protein